MQDFPKVITTCVHLTLVIIVACSVGRSVAMLHNDLYALYLVIIVACSVGQSVAKRMCVNVAHGDIGMKVLLV